MVSRLVGHRAFAPALALAALAWGSAVVALLLFGPGLTPWVDRLLVACFGWNAATRHYRLDTVLVALLQPPLLVGAVALVYPEELAAMLRTARGRVAGGVALGAFLSLGVWLLATGDLASGSPPSDPQALSAPIRQGRVAPPFRLVDHRGQPLSEASLRGRPVALTFVYTGCHATCPVLIGRLRALETGAGPDTRFVAVTLDPERDTPAALADYAGRWELGPRWHLLTGPPPAVRELVSRYGVQWAPVAGGEIAHENVVVLLDRAGRIAFTYRGLAHPPTRLASDLARLEAERS